MNNSVPEKAIIYYPNQDIHLNVLDYIEYDENKSTMNFRVLSFATLCFLVFLATVDIIAVIPVSVVSIGILYLLYFFQQNVVLRKEIMITTKTIETLELMNNRSKLCPIYDFQQPNYFELVVQPNKEYLIVSICQFGSMIQSFLLHESADLTLLMESLQSLLNVEIYDTYQSKEGEEIIGFRPNGSSQTIPVLFTIDDDGKQLKIRPRFIEQLVTIDYNDKLIKTSAGYQYDTNDILMLNYKI